MRRTLEIVSVAALVVLIVETALSLYGPAPIRGSVPTHFNAAGNPDAWGAARLLWFLPTVSVVLYLLMTWVARHPAAFNYPVRVTPFNRQRLETLALSMIAWLKAELFAFFAFIQWTILRTARNPGRSHSSVPMPVLLTLVFLTTSIHFAGIFRAGRARP
jgi:hypothetical protein